MSDPLINVFGALLNEECSRLYCHLQIKLPFLNVVQENENCFLLKHLDNDLFFTIPNDDNSDFLQFRIRNIDKCTKSIIIDGFVAESNDIDDDCLLNVEFQSNFYIDFEQMKKLAVYSSHHEDNVEFFSVFKLELNEDESELPKSIEFDKSLLQVLNRPNPELLNDWLFCHNHSHHNDTSSSSINENYGPLILDHIEQIVHLLLNESDEILFESAEDKDRSLYIKIRQRDFYTTCEDSKTENNQTIRIKLQNSLLVWYKIFLPNDKSLKCDHGGGDDDVILLRKYRMSFTTDWYMITDALFKCLIDQLNRNSNQMKRFSSIMNFIFDNPDYDNDHRTISFLPSYSVSSTIK